MNTITLHDDAKTKTSELVARLKEKQDVWSIWSDQELDQHFPPPLTPTSRTFHNEEEPDLLNQSRDEITVPIMTLREYILLRLNGDKIYDIEGWTICNDRLSRFQVACGRWYPVDRRVELLWFGSGFRHPGCGARSAISLDSSSPSSLETAINQVKAAGYKVVKEY